MCMQKSKAGETIFAKLRGNEGVGAIPDCSVARPVEVRLAERAGKGGRDTLRHLYFSERDCKGKGGGGRSWEGLLS